METGYGVRHRIGTVRRSHEAIKLFVKRGEIPLAASLEETIIERYCL